MKRLAVTLTSIALSLGIAEMGASLVHRRAFPYLNIFESDRTLGVRLRPNATTRIRSRSGRVTEIRTNSLGFRGDEWATTGELMILGDSQMFGYNVEQSATLASLLGARGAVFNAAVPTYGPPDYAIALRRLAPRHHPRVVLFVANAANDWFEPVPNFRRTTAQDGWATRVGTPAPRAFPFRNWLMRESHLVFGVRQVANFVSEAQLPSTQSAMRLKQEVARLRRKEGDRSTITPHLRHAVKICAELDCKVVAVALPSDVQVSPAEWAKYRTAAIDLTATEALLDDFVADARDLGLAAVNLLPALRAAEPGAFLDDDYHLSAKGHRAVADAIAATLESNP